MATERTARDIIRELLTDLRNDQQGGYSSYLGDGNWSSRSLSIGYVRPSDLNKLFEFAGLVPDVIESLGSCDTCKHSYLGKSRGWDLPCVSCAGPKMSNWEKKPGFTKRLTENIEKLAAAMPGSHDCNGRPPGFCFIHQEPLDRHGRVARTRSATASFREVQPYFLCFQCGHEIEIPYTLAQLKKAVLP